MQDNRIPYEVTYIRSELQTISKGECVLAVAIIISLTLSLILMVLGVI